MSLKHAISFLAVSLLLLSSCGAGKKAARNASVEHPAFPAVEQGGKTAVVAHRGFWKCAAAGFAQNSIAALREAQNAGFWGSECDIHLTADNVILVHHDGAIHDLDIQKNKVEAFAEHRLKNGESVPTLDEYLAQARQSDKTVLIIELKPHYAPEREDVLVDLTVKSLKAAGLYDPSRVAFISFSKHICDVLAAECPEFVNQYLNGELTPEQLDAAAVNGFDYEDTVLKEHPEYIKRAHKKGMSTNVWTVNDVADMAAFVKLGIDAITTNEPLLLRDLLDNKEYKRK